MGYMERKIKMNGSENTVKHKARPRSDEELRQLQNRLSRITGQLNGIGRMLEENRYCGDVLIPGGRSGKSSAGARIHDTPVTHGDMHGG